MKKMEQTEIWRDVPEYEGIYQVSNLGRVKSLARKGSDGRQLKEMMMKTRVTNSGYLILTLRKSGVYKTHLVHALVAMAFLNHKPNGHKIVVDHINNDPLDNRLENLQIITQRENSSKDKKRYSSKYVGVFWHKVANKWKATIVINGKQRSLGLFTNELKAHEAYQSALNQLSI